MPELPEVERARKQLHALCVGRTITSIDATEDAIVYTGGTTANSFASHVKDKLVVDTFRRGKVFGLLLSEAPHVVMHFGMTGNIAVKGVAGFEYVDFKTDAEFPPRFCKFAAVLDDGSEFAFADGRRLARIRLCADPLNEAPISELGCDALDAMMDVDELGRALRKRKVPVKAVLLDQSFVAGIGNWIADEVLYHAGIHPAQKTNTLLDTEVAALHASIEKVLRIAVDANADSEKFPKTWLFHYRWFKGKRGKKGDNAGPPAMPDGNLIEFETHGGRTSAVVSSVQKLRREEGAEELDDVKKSATVKKRVVSKKKKQQDSEDDSQDDDDVKTPAKGKKKVVSRRKKQKDSEADSEDASVNDNEDDVDVKAPAIVKKRAVSKRKKPQESEDDDDDDFETVKSTRKGRTAKAESETVPKSNTTEGAAGRQKKPRGVQAEN
ncbi:hypothetical protein HDU98_011802 [Podochytrium sp. JEL0797]|nr:hypothetical protein HDU98_011802 [Podochytrium sp. JEL0797]